ncbi:general odorant-binding protein 71 isoform X2 [Belonocnema kinseyi]|uniref:general odorant-binding protein 71 isoform X2 n=1 Tax=Belonocnema kinseyi TaxID=2817044 RepID=UPI00143E0EA6|nr:general odorant-binding protein 71 isoform X2 [Belonocnema kinseyi]
MRVILLLFLLSTILLFGECSALRCRTGNQQSNEKFRKVMQTCRRRNSNNGRNADYSNESNSDESDSDEDMFDKRFLSGVSHKNNTYSSGYGSNNRERYDGKQKRQKRSKQSNFKETNMKNDRYGSNSRSSGTDFHYDHHNNNNKNNNNNQRDNGDYRRGPACVIQCFFNELNLVDQRGFPERNSVTGIMTENIQDPELRDFVEESITECFHYLRSDLNQDKCKFSQNLLSCLADKGSETCDDWNDD